MAQIIDSYNESNQSTYFDIPEEASGKVGQSFIGDGGTLNSVKFNLKKSGATSGNCYAKIYSHSGVYGISSIPDALLAVSDPIDVTTISATGFNLVTFVFSGENKITLTNGVNYCVVFDNTAGGSNWNISLGLDADFPTHGGNYFDETNGLVADPTRDICFYIYKDEASVSPSISFSLSPSLSPSFSPSISPSLSPSISKSPSISPSISPSPSSGPSWSGIGMNMSFGWYNDDGSFAGSLVDELVANGIYDLRQIEEWDVPARLALAKTASIIAKNKGARVVFGVLQNNTLTAANWGDYRTAVLSAAQWAQDNGMYEFQIGNEEEYHNDDTTLTDAQLIANLKSLATEVQAIYTSGNVSYSCFSDNINDWVTAGKGDIDLLASNIYMEWGDHHAEPWQSEIDALVTAFGVNGTYLSEFGPNSYGVNSYSTDESVQAAGVVTELNYIIASGITRAYYYEYISDDFGAKTYADHFRLLWYELVSGHSASASPSLSPSISKSPSLSPSVSPSLSSSKSPSVSPSVSASVSISPSISPSVSKSPSISLSLSPSLSPSISSSVSPSISKSPSLSSSLSPSFSPSISSSLSPSISKSPSISPSKSPSISPSISSSISPSIAPPMSSLTDNFNDNSIDGTKWTIFANGTGSVVESGQKIICTPQASLANADAILASVDFIPQFNLTNSYALVQVLQVCTSFALTVLNVLKDDHYYFRLLTDGSDIYAVSVVNDVYDGDVNSSTISYSPTTMVWFRIRELGGNIYWEYSADGINWTELTHLANPFDVTLVYSTVEAYANNIALPGAAWFDNFNTTGVSFSPSISPSFSPSVSSSISKSPSFSPSFSPSLSFSISPSVSPSVSRSPSISLSLSPSLSSSLSLSISPSVSPSVSKSPSLSPSISPSLSFSLSPSVSSSISPSISKSPSLSPSVSFSISSSLSLSFSPSVSPSVSRSPSLSPSFSQSLSPSLSSSFSFSISPSVSKSPSLSSSVSFSLSPSLSFSISPSFSISRSPSFSLSVSPSISFSVSPSASPSVVQYSLLVDYWEVTFPGVSFSPSLSLSLSLSISLSFSPSISPSISLSPSFSPSLSISLSPSVSPSFSLSVSPSVSFSPSLSSSISFSFSPSKSFSISPSLSSSISLSPSLSISISPSISPSISLSPSLSFSLSPSLSFSVSLSISPSVSLSPSMSPSKSPSVSPSVSLSPSFSPSLSFSLSPSFSFSLSPSVSPSESFSPSLSFSVSPSFSFSISPSVSFSPSISPSLSFSVSLSPSVSPSLSLSKSPSVSPSPSEFIRLGRKEKRGLYDSTSRSLYGNRKHNPVWNKNDSMRLYRPREEKLDYH